MKVQVLSDLHFEFHWDHGHALVDSVYMDDTDVLVIAGDLGSARVAPSALSLICEKFKKAKILFVPGNHDFYGSRISTVLANFRSLESKFKNLYCLYNRAVNIEGRTFVGTTLWFSRTDFADQNQNRLSDFFCIRNFENEVYVQNKLAIEFLTKMDVPDAFVITHHLPTQRSVSAAFKDDPLNAFFVCSMDAMILKKMPLFWVHGHTHYSFNYTYYQTRILCNPFGYIATEENIEFNPHFSVEF